MVVVCLTLCQLLIVHLFNITTLSSQEIVGPNKKGENPQQSNRLPFILPQSMSNRSDIWADIVKQSVGNECAGIKLA